MGKKLRCDCGKWIARLDDDGFIYVWCKNCKKEVRLPNPAEFLHKDDGKK